MSEVLLKYFIFVISFISVTAIFVTAKTFTQLAIAIALYPILAFFAFKAFPNIWSPSNPSTALRTSSLRVNPFKPKETYEIRKKEGVKVADIEKRLFLKLIGATGLSFFLMSIFSRRVESLILNQNQAHPVPVAGNLKDSQTTVAASLTDEYEISGIDYGIEGYLGFIKKDGGWYIMKEDLDNGSFLYTNGDSDFPKNWRNRKNLKYDYFDNVFKI